MSKNKTRTKDKYRVVYNDTQRIELENEFRLNEYIAIPRKQEIARKLELSERQIKIWFQNRRAKKRKQQKRRQTSNIIHATNCNTPTTNNSHSQHQPNQHQHHQHHHQQQQQQQQQHQQPQPQPQHTNHQAQPKTPAAPTGASAVSAANSSGASTASCYLGVPSANHSGNSSQASPESARPAFAASFPINAPPSSADLAASLDAQPPQSEFDRSRLAVGQTKTRLDFENHEFYPCSSQAPAIQPSPARSQPALRPYSYDNHPAGDCGNASKLAPPGPTIWTTEQVERLPTAISSCSYPSASVDYGTNRIEPNSNNGPSSHLNYHARHRTSVDFTDLSQRNKIEPANGYDANNYFGYESESRLTHPQASESHQQPPTMDYNNYYVDQTHFIGSTDCAYYYGPSMDASVPSVIHRGENLKNALYY